MIGFVIDNYSGFVFKKCVENPFGLYEMTLLSNREGTTYGKPYLVTNCINWHGDFGHSSET